MPTAKADAALLKALMRGTRSGGITFMRADLWHHYEHVHHYYGCPEDNPCDHYELAEPFPWEKTILLPPDYPLEDSADTIAQSNLMNWFKLATVGAHFEALIRERWLKKTVAQRKVLLLDIWPGIPPNHRPDIDGSVIKACAHQRSARGMAQYAYPHLNLEDLTLPNSMLILFNARSRSLPSRFALSDYELAQLMKLRPALLGPTKLSMNVTDEYGTIHEWDSKADASASIRSGSTVHPTVGMHILLLQCGMLEFLVDFVCEMLPDKFTEPMSELPEINLELPSIPDNDKRYSTLGTVIREAPYRVPALLDLGSLRALVLARRNEVEDHIWLLREDPGYFAEVVFEAREHRPELLVGATCGELHENAQEETLWARVLRNVAVYGYVELSV